MKRPPSRLPSLGVQIGLAFAAVAALTALLAAAFVALSWQGTFDSYVREGVQSDATVFADAAARSYSASDSWQRGSLANIALVGVNRGLRVQFLNAEDVVVLDSAELQTSTTMQGVPTILGLGVGPGTGTGGELREPIVRVPVYVEGVYVGAVRVASISSGTFLTDRDVSFRSASSSGLTVAALLAVALATAGGVAYSRLVTRPLERLTRTAAALKAGKLDARSGVAGEDPIGVLGNTLDGMADAIKAEREFERRLTADVAHELRTPLQAIQATVEAMQDGVMPADAEHLGVVRDETVRLGRLADSILELSRLENRSAPMDAVPIDLAVPLSRSVETHRALLESLELTLVETIGEGIVVVGDADRLTQAFGNLLSNAAHYTPPGGTITITLKAEGADAVATIADTGIGVAADDRERVFARFWRSDHARERSRGGFGIGLAVVREIVEQHGGTVALRSNEPGPGTTLLVRVPLADRRVRVSTVS